MSGAGTLMQRCELVYGMNQPTTLNCLSPAVYMAPVFARACQRLRPAFTVSTYHLSSENYTGRAPHLEPLIFSDAPTSDSRVVRVIGHPADLPFAQKGTIRPKG